MLITSVKYIEDMAGEKYIYFEYCQFKVIATKGALGGIGECG